MGSSTSWGTETHHSDYEDYVTGRMTSYSSSFNTYLSYDGSLTTLPAYNATLNVAYDTTFGGNNHLTCVWMDDNYNWSNSVFSGRCGQSLNLAVNSVADVLHTLYQETAPTSTLTPTPTPSPTSTLPSPTPSPSPTPTQTATPTTAPSPTTPAYSNTYHISKLKPNPDPHFNANRTVSNNTNPNSRDVSGCGNSDCLQKNS